MMGTTQVNMAVLIVSCDNYSDLWLPFITQFRKHWPECEYPVYLTCNQLSPRFDGIKTLAVGEDCSWSENLLRALASVKEDYVLLYIEDLLLYAPVRTEQLARILSWVAIAQPNHVRLTPSESPTRPHNNLVGEVEPGAPYRTSTILSLWKKEVLAKLLIPGENAWQFEIVGSSRSDAYPGFFTSYQTCFPIINGVIKGKWTRSAVKRLLAQGVPLALERRATMTAYETIKHFLLIARSRLFQLLPWRMRRKIRLSLAL